MTEQTPHPTPPHESATAHIAAQIGQAISKLPIIRSALAVEYIDAASDALQDSTDGDSSHVLAEAIGDLQAASQHALRAEALLLEGVTALDTYTGQNGFSSSTGPASEITKAATGHSAAPAGPAGARNNETSGAASDKPRIKMTPQEIAFAVHAEAEAAVPALQRLSGHRHHTRYAEELDGLSPEALAILLQQGLPGIDEALIRRFEKGLWNRANEVARNREMRTLEVSDLWIAGAEEFLRSCKVYRPGKLSLAQFALRNAQNLMKVEAANTVHSVHIPVEVQEIITSISRENQRREAAGLTPMTDAELLENYHIVPGPPGKPYERLTVGAIRQAILLSRGLISIDTNYKGESLEARIPISKSGHVRLTPMHGEEVTDPADDVARIRMTEDVHRLLDTFPPKYAEWIRLRYGMGDNGPMTVKEAGEFLGLKNTEPQSRDTAARQLLLRIFNKRLLHGYGQDGATYISETTPWPPSHNEATQGDS